MRHYQTRRYPVVCFQRQKVTRTPWYIHMLQEMGTDLKGPVNTAEYSRQRPGGLGVSFSSHRRQSIPLRSTAVFVNGRCKPTLKSLVKTHQVSYSLWAPEERPHSLSRALFCVLLLYSGKLSPFDNQGYLWEPLADVIFFLFLKNCTNFRSSVCLWRGLNMCLWTHIWPDQLDLQRRLSAFF